MNESSRTPAPPPRRTAAYRPRRASGPGHFSGLLPALLAAGLASICALPASAEDEAPAAPAQPALTAPAPPATGTVNSAAGTAPLANSPGSAAAGPSSPVPVATPALPAPTTVAGPTATPAPSSPTAAGASRTGPKGGAVDPAIKKACDAHYPSRLQADVRAACAFGAQALARSRRKSAQVQCRLSFGASARATMACLIGATIAEDLAANKTSFDAKRLACAAHYPAHTEVDIYLQESCLTGAYMPRTLAKSDGRICREITPERSFIGPCATGVSLATNPPALAPAPGAAAPSAEKTDDPSDASNGARGAGAEPEPDPHNRLCDRYFDHRQLHQGYRACLSARGYFVGAGGKLADVLASCDQIVSDSQSDVEKAACVVGASISRTLASGLVTNPRFQKCGKEKVSYEERDVLACLTAASFLDFGTKGDAERACKALFAGKKSASRGDCERAVGLF